MKLLTSILLILFIGLVFVKGEETGNSWHTDFKKAQTIAEKSGKPMLVNFTGSDWCGWCIKLDSEVFSKKEFKSWASDNVVLVKLDFPRRTKQDRATEKQNSALAQKYSVSGFPTVLFLDPKGKKIGISGYMKGGPSAWTKSAESIIK